MILHSLVMMKLHERLSSPLFLLLLLFNIIFLNVDGRHMDVEATFDF